MEMDIESYRVTFSYAASLPQAFSPYQKKSWAGNTKMSLVILNFECSKFSNCWSSKATSK